MGFHVKMGKDFSGLVGVFLSTDFFLKRNIIYPCFKEKNVSPGVVFLLVMERYLWHTIKHITKLMPHLMQLLVIGRLSLLLAGFEGIWFVYRGPSL